MAPSLVLAFQMCLTADPSVCTELAPVPLKEELGIIGCALAAQQEGAKWVSAHPNYFVKRARCIAPSKLLAAT